MAACITFTDKSSLPLYHCAAEGGEKPPQNQAWTMEHGGFRTQTFRIRYCFEEVGGMMGCVCPRRTALCR